MAPYAPSAAKSLLDEIGNSLDCPSLGQWLPSIHRHHLQEDAVENHVMQLLSSLSKSNYEDAKTRSEQTNDDLTLDLEFI